MEKLNLPKIKIDHKKPVLTMDEYLRFVEFNLKHAGAHRYSREERLAIAVKIPFKLKA